MNELAQLTKSAADPALEQAETATAHERAAYAVDGITPETVLYPASAEEVAQALHEAAEQRLAVIPCRNGTKLQTGNIPRRYDVALCLKQMNSVWHYEPADLTASVEPGMKLGDFEYLLSRHGLWLPVDPPGGMKSSLGGIAATNAAGPLRMRYGAPRDFIIGMKIATTSGEVVKTGGRVVKNVAGYDLARLLTGSYGTLGVIVELSVKLFPLPRSRTSQRAEVSLSAARELRRRILASPLQPMRMVLLNAGAAAFVLGGDLREAEHTAAQNATHAEIWLEFGGSEKVIERSLKDLGALAAAEGIAFQALDQTEAEAGWNRLADMTNALAQAEPSLVALNAALPIAECENFLELAAAEAGRIGARLFCTCQSGVGIVKSWLVAGEPPAAVLPVIGRLRGAATERGGALVIERCPVALKREVDVWGPAGDAASLMRKLKATWDPRETLSPGRFVEGL